MKTSTSRREIKIESPSHMLRVFKSYQGDVIYVYRHDFSESLSNAMGRNFYEVKGHMVDSISTKGKYGCTLKDVAETYTDSERLAA